MGDFYSQPGIGFPLAFLIVVCQYIDMFCINCSNPTTNIVNSRKHRKSPVIWRRHHCQACKQAFTTHEKPVFDASIEVTGLDGNTEPFSYGKLILSIAASFTHDRYRGESSCADLTDTVVSLLFSQRAQGLLSQQQIAATTYGVLKRFDAAAGLQYGAAHGLLTPLGKERKLARNNG